VQVQGDAMRMKVFKASVNKVMRFTACLCCYTHALLIQVSQSVAQNHHSIEQRCCRWLLMNHDRGCDQFPITQVPLK